jgi:hypothetical protein
MSEAEFFVPLDRTRATAWMLTGLGVKHVTLRAQPGGIDNGDWYVQDGKWYLPSEAPLAGRK